MPARNDTIVGLQFQTTGTAQLIKAAELIERFQKTGQGRSELAVVLRALGVKNVQRQLDDLAKTSTKFAQEIERIRRTKTATEKELERLDKRRASREERLHRERLQRQAEEAREAELLTRRTQRAQTPGSFTRRISQRQSLLSQVSRADRAVGVLSGAIPADRFSFGGAVGTTAANNFLNQFVGAAPPTDPGVEFFRRGIPKARVLQGSAERALFGNFEQATSGLSRDKLFRSIGQLNNAIEKGLLSQIKNLARDAERAGVSGQEIDPRNIARQASRTAREVTNAAQRRLQQEALSRVTTFGATGGSFGRELAGDPTRGSVIRRLTPSELLNAANLRSITRAGPGSFPVGLGEAGAINPRLLLRLLGGAGLLATAGAVGGLPLAAGVGGVGVGGLLLSRFLGRRGQQGAGISGNVRTTAQRLRKQFLQDNIPGFETSRELDSDTRRLAAALRRRERLNQEITRRRVAAQARVRATAARRGIVPGTAPPPPPPGGPPPRGPTLFGERGLTFGPGDNRRFRGFGTAVRTVGQFAGASAIIFTVVNSVREATRAFIEFEDVLVRIQGVFPTRADLARLQIQRSVIDSTRRFRVGLLDAAESAKIFAQQGLSTTEVTRELEATLTAVQGAGLDATQAREFLTAVRNITQEEVTSLEILDRISRVESRRAVDAQALAQAIQRAGPLARQFRGDLAGLVDELDLVIGATTAIVERSRVSGQQAATSLRFILARLGRPQVLRDLQRFGVDLAVAGSEGRRLRPLIEILDELGQVFARLRKESTAEATQFLVSLAGARQINAASILLDSINDVFEVSEISAEAFGDAQERLALRLQTTKSRLTGLRNEFQLFIIDVLDGGTAGALFNTVIGSTTAILRGFGNITRSGSANLLLFGATAFGAAKLVGALAKSISLLFVADSAAQVARLGLLTRTISRLFGITAIGITGGSLAAFTKGIVGMINPVTAAVVALGALAAGIAAVVTIARRNRRDPLRAAFLSQEDANDLIEQNARVQRLRAEAARFGVDPTGLVEAFVQAGSTLNQELRAGALGDGDGSFLDILRQLEEQSGLTRLQVIDRFLNELQGTPAEPLVTAINEAAEGMEDLEAATFKVTTILNLMGDASFIAFNIFGANVQRATDQAQQLVEGISAITAASDEFSRRRLLLSRGPLGTQLFVPGLPIGADRDVGSIVEQITEILDIKGIPKEIGELFGQFFEIDPVVFQGAVERLGDTAAVSIGDFFGVFADEFEAQASGPGGQEFKDKFVAGFADLLGEALGEGSAKALITSPGIQDSFTRVLDIVQDIAPRAIEQIRSRLETTVLGGPQAARLREITLALGRFGQGEALASANIGDQLFKVQDPLRQFTLDLFGATQQIDANARAAKELGLTYNETQERLNVLTRFGFRLFNIEAQFQQQILQNLVTAQQAVGGQAEETLDALSTVFSEGGRLSGFLESQGADQLQNAIREQGNRGVNQAIVTALELARRLREEFSNEQFNLLTLVTDVDSPEAQQAVTKFRILLAQLAGELPAELPDDTEQLADVLKTVDVTLGKIFSTYGSIRDIIVDATIEQNKFLASLEQQEKIGTLRLQNEKDIATNLLNSNVRLRTEGLRPILALQSSLEQINASAALDIQFAERRLELQLDTIARRQQELQLSDDVVAKDVDRVTLARDLAIVEAQAALEKQRAAEILKATEEEILALRRRQVENTEARLAGLRTILTDFERLTSGEAVREVLGTAGSAFLQRQVDLLFESLFDAETGILKGIGRQIGIAGEADKFQQALIQGSTQGAIIIEQGIIRGFEGAVARTSGTSGIRGLAGLPSAQQQQVAVNNSRVQIQQLLQALGALTGNIAGSALGGGGANARAGAGFGTLAGAIGGGLIGGPIAPIVGPLIGGLLGGLFGGGFDEPERPDVRQLEVIARNTGETITLLENTNKLLDPGNLAFNLPSRFRLPSFGPNVFGASGGGAGAVIPGFVSAGASGGAGVNVAVNATINVQGGATPRETGKEIANAITRELTSQLVSAGNRFVPRT